MMALDAKKCSSSDSSCNNISSHSLLFSTDCYPFLNWSEDQPESEKEKAVVFRSLVATLKLQPALDVSLEDQAARFLKSMTPQNEESANCFLNSFGRTTDESPTAFIQPIGVLLSSTSQVVTTAAMKMLESLILNCPEKTKLTLVQADLIPQLINTLNPQSLSFSGAVDIHTGLLSTISNYLWIATLFGLEQLGIEAPDEQQAVHETFFQQVVTPLEKYICHLCLNRFSIIDRDLSIIFLELLAQLIRICPYYQPSMDIVVNMPIFLTIPSCLTFFEFDRSIGSFLFSMTRVQREWNRARREKREMGNIELQILRMEGFEEVIEAKLRNDKKRSYGGFIVSNSIDLKNRQGTNLPKQE